MPSTTDQDNTSFSAKVNQQSSRRWLKILVLGLANLIIVAGLFFAGLQIGKKQEQSGVVEILTPTPFLIPSPSSTPEEKVSITSLLTPTPWRKVSHTKEKIFFVESLKIRRQVLRNRQFLSNLCFLR